MIQTPAPMLMIGTALMIGTESRKPMGPIHELEGPAYPAKTRHLGGYGVRHFPCVIYTSGVAYRN
jgi:hypothetical protein